MAELIRAIDPALVRRNLELVRERAGSRPEILVATKYVADEELPALDPPDDVPGLDGGPPVAPGTYRVADRSVVLLVNALRPERTPRRNTARHAQVGLHDGSGCRVGIRPRD